MAKIVYAGIKNPSFQQGSEDMAVLAEVTVSTKQVERVTERIGHERCAERTQHVEDYQSLPLMKRKDAPDGVTPPPIAVVEVDGGRIQILERTKNGKPDEPPLDPDLVEDEGRRGKHWREDKIGLLMTMTSEATRIDPCPNIPANFVDPTRIAKLARELKKRPPIHDDGLQAADKPETANEALADNQERWHPPEVTEKRFVASRCRWPEFGPLLARAAWQWGVFQSPRKAFVADGSDNNWTLWRNQFSSFVPILDWIHGLSYVYASAMAGRSFGEGWLCYVKWITWVWQGEVDLVIAELTVRQAELGTPKPEDTATSPPKIVATSLTYLQNQKARMRYPEYRRLGLPITSSYVESAVKQFNKRVKGTEKFWTEKGAESILQLCADYFSEDTPLDEYWQRRQDNVTGQNQYNMAV